MCRLLILSYSKFVQSPFGSGVWSLWLSVGPVHAGTFLRGLDLQIVIEYTVKYLCPCQVELYTVANYYLN